MLCFALPYNAMPVLCLTRACPAMRCVTLLCPVMSGIAMHLPLYPHGRAMHYPSLLCSILTQETVLYDAALHYTAFYYNI